MNAKIQSKIVLTKYQFTIDFEGKAYEAEILLNEKDKFIEETVRFAANGAELEKEGEEGDIFELIIDFLDQNWESLIKESN